MKWHHFKEGSLKIAEKAGCPIIPMAITHTRDIIKDHIPFVKTNPCHDSVWYAGFIQTNCQKKKTCSGTLYTEYHSGNANFEKPEAYKLPARASYSSPGFYKLPPLP